LIFDEVLTSFQTGLQGVLGFFAVTPELTTLAKGLGGGFPVSSTSVMKMFVDL
jgi:glutamate-1-semialdehyde 2,1-aminomutase